MLQIPVLEDPMSQRQYHAQTIIVRAQSPRDADKPPISASSASQFKHDSTSSAQSGEFTLRLISTPSI